MKEKPILFSGDMVRAILEGRKTQTRRVIKPQPPVSVKDIIWLMGEWIASYPNRKAIKPFLWQSKCPYGKPGNQLWVRETWRFGEENNGHDYVNYRADNGKKYFPNVQNLKYPDHPWDGKWRPSIHIPRWASRIQLEITNVRVERVQDITAIDCMKEGIEPDTLIGSGVQKIAYNLVMKFKYLWNSINEKRGYSWDSNPWAWVIEFRVI